jgi:parallel beta-helix repeat protein
LNRAFGALKAGDTLYIRGGVYTETTANFQNIIGGDSWSTATTVAAYPGETVTIRPSSDTPTGRLAHFYGPNSHYIIIDGLILDAINVSADACRINDELGTGRAHHIRIKNSELKNARGNGCKVDGIGNEFINDKIHDNATFDFKPYGHGLYISASDNLVDGCLIYNNGGGNYASGVEAYLGALSASSPVDNIVVRNNTIYGHRFGAGIQLWNGSNDQAYNNVVYSNGGGIDVGTGASNTQIFNNTVYSNVAYAIQVHNSANTVIRNNITWLNGGAQPVTDAGSATYSQDHNITTDPLFVNPATGDFRLSSTNSPAYDGGVTISVVTSDKVGITRPQGTGYDVGAFEYPLGTLTLLPPQNLRIAP